MEWGKLGKCKEFYIPIKCDSKATLGFTLSLSIIFLLPSIFFQTCTAANPHKGKATHEI